MGHDGRGKKDGNGFVVYGTRSLAPHREHAKEHAVTHIVGHVGDKRAKMKEALAWPIR